MTHAAPQTDEELIERARQGDSRAFQLLVERYESNVAATVVSMLGRSPEAGRRRAGDVYSLLQGDG